jgi:hypothetical protein
MSAPDGGAWAGTGLVPGLRELLKQAVIAEQVFMPLVVFQQFVEWLRSDRWHNQISFRD